MVSVLILQVKQSPLLGNPLAYGKYSISCGLFISSCYSEEDDRRRAAVRARDLRCCARAAPPDFSPRLRSKPHKWCSAPKTCHGNAETMRQWNRGPAESKRSRSVLSWRHSGACPALHGLLIIKLDVVRNYTLFTVFYMIQIYAYC